MIHLSPIICNFCDFQKLRESIFELSEKQMKEIFGVVFEKIMIKMIHILLNITWEVYVLKYVNDLL